MSLGPQRRWIRLEFVADEEQYSWIAHALWWAAAAAAEQVTAELDEVAVVGELNEMSREYSADWMIR